MKYASEWSVWGIYSWLGWSVEVAEPIGNSVPVQAHHFLLALPLPRSNPTRYNYPTHSTHWHISFSCPWSWNRQWVPKRRLLEFRRRGITQKGTNYKWHQFGLTLFILVRIAALTGPVMILHRVLECIDPHPNARKLLLLNELTVTHHA